jgi:3-oxoacyl-[acyl-carrier protein] reductase
MESLNGLNVLVTGASGGIGAAIAKKLHSRGATIMLHGTRENVLQDMANNFGERAYICVAKLNNDADLKNIIPHATEKMGGVDILVNNAGITKDQLFMRMKDEDFNEVIRVNLQASFVLMRDAIKGMMKKRWGRIINITSVVGVTGNPGQANYCASKAGMIGMTKSIAQEVASRNITANCVAPGFIETPMTDVLTEDQKDRILSTIPASRLGQPDEIAHVVEFLASKEAAYITGQTIHVNGGMVMI